VQGSASGHKWNGFQEESLALSTRGRVWYAGILSVRRNSPTISP
jgi:hypothetical protein